MTCFFLNSQLFLNARKTTNNLRKNCKSTILSNEGLFYFFTILKEMNQKS